MSNFNSYYNSEIIRQVISVVVLNEHNVLSMRADNILPSEI